jgi:hypothetical protein
MATNTGSVATDRAAIWEDFIDIFYAPSAVFARREHGSIWIPLTVVTLLMGTLAFVNSGVMQPIVEAEFERGLAAAMRDNPNMSPEAVERMRNFGSRMAQIVQLGTFVFVPIGMFVVGCALWVAGKLVDAKQSFHAALIVSAYSFIPRVVEAVVNGVQGVLLDPSQLDGRFRLSFGPGRFLDPDTASPILLAIIGRMDVFTIWITVLLAIGLSVTGKIPRLHAAVAAAIVWVAGGIPLVLQALRASS